ncbi:hypothetical protein RintRC_4106 [Richelia intracellularis]|nr:hypothetical protein RintRC_4106 [Richelia intracellularis]
MFAKAALNNAGIGYRRKDCQPNFSVNYKIDEELGDQVYIDILQCDCVECLNLWFSQ